MRPHGTVVRGDRRTRSPLRGLAAVGVTIVTGVLLAPAAHADPTAQLTSALVQARAGSSCPALRFDPLAEQAAAKVNQSTQEYLDHAADQVPITDPLPGLKILGYGGSKATLVQGAALNAADSIKALLLLGYNKIPDCSYTDYGANMQYNEGSGYLLTAVVLAGP